MEVARGASKFTTQKKPLVDADSTRLMPFKLTFHPRSAERAHTRRSASVSTALVCTDGCMASTTERTLALVGDAQIDALAALRADARNVDVASGRIGSARAHGWLEVAAAARPAEIGAYERRVGKGDLREGARLA